MVSPVKMPWRPLCVVCAPDPNKGFTSDGRSSGSPTPSASGCGCFALWSTEHAAPTAAATAPPAPASGPTDRPPAGTDWTDGSKMSEGPCMRITVRVKRIKRVIKCFVMLTQLNLNYIHGVIQAWNQQSTDTKAFSLQFIVAALV